MKDTSTSQMGMERKGKETSETAEIPESKWLDTNKRVTHLPSYQWRCTDCSSHSHEHSSQRPSQHHTTPLWKRQRRGGSDCCLSGRNMRHWHARNVQVSNQSKFPGAKKVLHRWLLEFLKERWTKDFTDKMEQGTLVGEGDEVTASKNIRNTISGRAADLQEKNENRSRQCTIGFQLE